MEITDLLRQGPSYPVAHLGELTFILRRCEAPCAYDELSELGGESVLSRSLFLHLNESLGEIDRPFPRDPDCFDTGVVNAVQVDVHLCQSFNQACHYFSICHGPRHPGAS